MNRALYKLLPGAVAIAVTLSAAADYVRENELDIATDVQSMSIPHQVVDLRAVIPVATLADDALHGLMYSAFGFERGAAADASRTATIMAQAGTLANGVFTPDGTAGIAVLPETTGEGTVDWSLTDISKNIYRLTHTVRKDDVVDASGFHYCYFDFTHCLVWSPQAEVEAAVLGEVTHAISVIQDEYWPWQPIDVSTARSGIMTIAGLEPGEETATAFAFKGRGVLHCEYELSGGELTVIADGNVVSTITEPTTGWVPYQVEVDGYEAHEVSFVHTAAGGAEAAIRNVRWEVLEESSRTTAADAGVRIDLQPGKVRTPVKFSQVLPFVYSPTNFTGTVDGKSSRVSVVRLKGDDPDVTKWTAVGAPQTLKKATDEGEVKWMPRKGVWKATFEIYDGTELKDTQIMYFDLRNATGNGTVLIIT